MQFQILFKKFLKVLSNLYYPHIFVLSSAKLASLASLIKKKSFIKRLKRIGPRIDSWGTPDKKI